MQEIILIKNGELALKGLNRSSFESVLVKNIKRRMHGLGKFVINRSQSTLTIEPQDDTFDMEEAVDRLSRVFGIAGFERAAAVEKSMDAIFPLHKDVVRWYMLKQYVAPLTKQSLICVCPEEGNGAKRLRKCSVGNRGR